MGGGGRWGGGGMVGVRGRRKGGGGEGGSGKERGWLGGGEEEEGGGHPFYYEKREIVSHRIAARLTDLPQDAARHPHPKKQKNPPPPPPPRLSRLAWSRRHRPGESDTAFAATNRMAFRSRVPRPMRFKAAGHGAKNAPR